MIPKSLVPNSDFCDFCDFCVLSVELFCATLQTERERGVEGRGREGEGEGREGEKEGVGEQQRRREEGGGEGGGAAGGGGEERTIRKQSGCQDVRPAKWPGYRGIRDQLIEVCEE